MKTDAEIIQEYQQGRDAAFDELATRYMADMYRFFYVAIQNEEDAEDLTQSTLFKLYKNLHQFRFQAEFKTYLYTIKTNVIRNYFRKKKIRSIFDFNEPNENISIQPDTSEPALEPSNLWDGISQLPPKQRLVVIMRLTQQLPFKDIDMIMGLKAGSAKVNYHYGIKTLQKIVEK